MPALGFFYTIASSAFSTFPRCCLESNSRSAAMRGSCHDGYFSSGVITNGLRLSELALTSFLSPSGVPGKGRKSSHNGSVRVISHQRRELLLVCRRADPLAQTVIRAP